MLQGGIQNSNLEALGNAKLRPLNELSSSKLTEPAGLVLIDRTPSPSASTSMSTQAAAQPTAASALP